MDELESLRSRLAAIDDRLLHLLAERRLLAHSVGQEKQKQCAPLRDFEQERIVLERGRKEAVELGIPPPLSDSLLKLLIRDALAVQEEGRVAGQAEGSGRKVLVIGGAGRMGRWFVDFLASQGYQVEVADPAGEVSGHDCVSDWSDTPLDHDFIVVAAKLRVSRRILTELAEKNPPGVVFDIGSLKGPLQQGLRSLTAAGVRATSVHPMFGPDTTLLSGKHVIFVDLGSPEATQLAKGLFSSTMAQLVDMSLEEHDRVIAMILGLSHALNIAFSSALAATGEPLAKLSGLSSSTFDDQLAVATRVADDNPHLYFEIQSLNRFGDLPLAALEEAVARLRSIVIQGDEEAFVQLMDQGRKTLSKLQ